MACKEPNCKCRLWGAGATLPRECCLLARESTIDKAVDRPSRILSYVLANGPSKVPLCVKRSWVLKKHLKFREWLRKRLSLGPKKLQTVELTGIDRN